MASIGKCSQPLKATALPLFSQPCLYARSLPKYTALRAKTSPSRYCARTFMNSAALREKKYTKDHEWVEISEDGKIGTIGISTYAAKALGDVVFIELPTLDLDIAAGDVIGAVESVKSASDILAPLSGKVVATNELLESEPGIINQEPEGEGWIANIELKGETAEGLMDEEAYRAFTEE